jgi:hypothetical protein
MPLTGYGLPEAPRITIGTGSAKRAATEALTEKAHEPD